MSTEQTTTGFTGAACSAIAVKFLLHDSSQSHHSYVFQCCMKCVPRIGDSVLLPSADHGLRVCEDGKTGMTAFAARVESVIWVLAQNDDGPDVIINAEFEWSY